MATGAGERGGFVHTSKYVGLGTDIHNTSIYDAFEENAMNNTRTMRITQNYLETTHFIGQKEVHRSKPVLFITCHNSWRVELLAARC